VTLRGRVTHKIDADDTPAYSDRSNQEKQYTNIQGSTAIQRDGAEPALLERGSAPVENTLVRIGIDAQRQRAVGLQRFVTRGQTDLTLAAPRYLLRLNRHILKSRTL
jgi:hypothetical protein